MQKGLGMQGGFTCAGPSSYVSGLALGGSVGPHSPPNQKRKTTSNNSKSQNLLNIVLNMKHLRWQLVKKKTTLPQQYP